MKKILIIISVCFSFLANSQSTKLYAIRFNIDNTIDSFYIKITNGLRGDSVFNGSLVYVARTVEYYNQSVNPTFPEGFDRFFYCADGLYRNVLSLTGVKVMNIPINADAGTNLVLTDQPNSEQPLANSQRSGVRVYSYGYTEARLTAIVMVNSASGNSPRLYFQYSTDGVSWTGDGTAGNISLSTTGAKETAWLSLPAEAIGNVYVRVAQNGGNGTADPALGNITIQLR